MSTQYIGLKLGSINTTIFKPGNGLVLKEASMIAMPTNPKNKEVYAVGDNAKKIRISPHCGSHNQACAYCADIRYDIMG